VWYDAVALAPAVAAVTTLTQLLPVKFAAAAVNAATDAAANVAASRLMLAMLCCTGSMHSAAERCCQFLAANG
jgi:hypothetical protein